MKRLEEAKVKGMRILSVIGVSAAILLFIFGGKYIQILYTGGRKTYNRGRVFENKCDFELFMAYEINLTGMLNG